MHIPDGFIDVQTSAIFAGLAAAGVATALKGARTQLDEKTAPLAGLTAVFIFAVQMLNFPVAAGTSGHLLGGALAAVLVGPWAATLALAVVLIMQGFLFADGGLTAIGRARAIAQTPLFRIAPPGPAAPDHQTTQASRKSRASRQTGDPPTSSFHR